MSQPQVDYGKVLLVTEQDSPIGTEDKLVAHQKGLLHRAFSVFVFRKHNYELELLLQQRQQDKYHCGGLWTNTCCSHPFPDEDIIEAGKRRLQEEMGFVTELQKSFDYDYFIIVTDHGFDFSIMNHSQYGFYSSNRKLEPEPRKITDFYQWVIKHGVD